MACYILGTKPLSEPMLTYCQFHPINIFQWNFTWKFQKLKHFHTRRCNGKCFLWNLSQFVRVSMCYLNILRPRQNGRHFIDNFFKCIFMNENIWISINISLKFVPMCPINNIPALVQIMSWRRPGDKPFSELMIVLLIDAYKCVTRSQWVNAVFTSHLHQCFPCCHP